MPDPQLPHGLQPSRLLRPRDFPGKSTGVGCHCPLWGLAYLDSNTCYSIYHSSSWGQPTWASSLGFLWKIELIIPNMYGCESLTVKKAERRRIDAFKLWCWRRLLRVPWTARRSNQSILKDQPWDFFGRNDAKAETPVLWPPHAKC